MGVQQVKHLLALLGCSPDRETLASYFTLSLGKDKRDILALSLTAQDEQADLEHAIAGAEVSTHRYEQLCAFLTRRFTEATP